MDLVNKMKSFMRRKWRVYDHSDKHVYRASFWCVKPPRLMMKRNVSHFLGGTLANYIGMKQRGGSALARAHQRLVIGPWSHINRTSLFLTPTTV
jgi:hypothetical protein